MTDHWDSKNKRNSPKYSLSWSNLSNSKNNKKIKIKKINQLNFLIQIAQPRERSYAAGAKNGNSKTSLYFRRPLKKKSFEDKTQRSIVKLLDIKNNKNTFCKRNKLTTAKEITWERNNIKYKEMQEQIKILRMEVTKLKQKFD